MKKQLFLLLALLTPLASMAQQQLTVGDVTMTINPEKGARILSFQYKGQEIISQLKAPESFGSTFWTSPQKEWNWPPVKEFDKMPYQVEERDGSLILTSEVSPRLKCRVRKEFTTDKKDNAIVITYSIINEGDEERQVAPWEITRVENKGGVIFFDAPLDGITPADLMPFTAANGAWYAYCNDGLLLLKTFDDLQPSQPAPGEAEIQVYVNRGKTFIELECQGAYTTLKPHEQLSWTVRWHLLPFKGNAEPSAKLMKTIKKYLH